MLAHSKPLDHFRMAPINDQHPPHPSSSNSQTHNIDFGQMRCYWILLNEDLRFLYVDPVYRSHLGSQAQSIVGRNLLEFIHPDEHARTQLQLQRAIDSRTLDGSVIRVRYTRLARARARLGFTGVVATSHIEDKVAYDENYILCDLIVNLAADNLVLCFIHAAFDISPADNDGTRRTPWTNWCGAPGMDIEDTNRLYRALAPIARSYSGGSPPTRIFQIMKGTADRGLLFSWPSFGYDPEEYRHLGNNVRIDADSGTDAKTSCTRRFSALHRTARENDMREIESLFTPYGQIIFACHSSTPYRLRTSLHAYSHSSQSYSSSEHTYYPPLTTTHAEGFSNGHSYGYPANQSSYIAHTSLPPERLSSTPPEMARGHSDTRSTWNTPSPVPMSQTSTDVNEHFAPVEQRQPSVYADDVPPPRQRTARSHAEDVGGSSKDVYGNASNRGNPPAGVMHCASCKTTSSPEWRKGPSGKKDLCNACGLRYSRAKAKREGITSRRRRDSTRVPQVTPVPEKSATKSHSSDEEVADLSIGYSQQRLPGIQASPPRDSTFHHLHSHHHSILTSPTTYTYSIEPRPSPVHVYSHSTTGGVTHGHPLYPSNYYHHSPSYHVHSGSPSSGDMTPSTSSTPHPPSSYVRGLNSDHRDGFHTQSDHQHTLHHQTTYNIK